MTVEIRYAPAVADVEAGLASYIETIERANKLEKKIERTDEEIEIVEEAVGE